MKVYAKTTLNGLITSVDSAAFIADLTGWIQIDEGEGDRYTHAQTNYFPLPLTTDEGVQRYKLQDGIPVERTVEEMAADTQQVTTPMQPTLEERIEALEAATLELIMGGAE